MSMLFALPSEDKSFYGCHYKEQGPLEEGKLIHWYSITLAFQRTELTFRSRKCHISYRYGFDKLGKRVHLLEDDGIEDLVSSEEGDCNVSDFCRVSIVEPTSAPKEEGKTQSAKKHKSKKSTSLRTRGGSGNWAGTMAEGTWYSSTCGASNSPLTPNFCPLCNSSR